MPVQLNLFSDQADPLPSHKQQKPKPVPKVIRTFTTEEAAILLGVSPSTLYRARQAGNAYKRDGDIAEPIGRNCWRVILPSSL